MPVTPAITFRETVPSDAVGVHAFIESFVDRQQLLPRNLDEIETLVRHAFVAERGSEMVGFSAVEIYSRKLAELQCMSVLPDCQGLGVGRQLVALCIERAKREGVMELMAISNQEHFLNECGFHFSLPNQKKAFFLHPDELGVDR